jgi:PAB1-binding protein PBP1
VITNSDGEKENPQRSTFPTIVAIVASARKRTRKRTRWDTTNEFADVDDEKQQHGKIARAPR